MLGTYNLRLETLAETENENYESLINVWVFGFLCDSSQNEPRFDYSSLTVVPQKISFFV